MSYEEIARKTNHDPNHVAQLFAESSSTPGIKLYLDLLRGSGGSLPDLVVNAKPSAVIERLRVEAESQGCGKAQLGRAIARDRSVISRLFNGHNLNPNLDLIAVLTDHLGLAEHVKIRRHQPYVVAENDVQSHKIEQPIVQAAGSRKGSVTNASWVPTVAGAEASSQDSVLTSRFHEQARAKDRWIDEANQRAREAQRTGEEKLRRETERRMQAERERDEERRSKEIASRRAETLARDNRQKRRSQLSKWLISIGLGLVVSGGAMMTLDKKD